MTPTSEQLCSQAHDHARRFLLRFADPLTRAERDDIAQDSAIAAWRWASAVCEPRRFAAAVRTIARRTRCRALREHHRRRTEEQAEDFDDSALARTTVFWIAGRPVSRDWLLPRVERALAELPALDRCLLLSSQEGFCCAEVADRYGLTTENVKVRTHRARRRVRIRVESAVRSADQLDGFDDQ